MDRTIGLYAHNLLLYNFPLASLVEKLDYHEF